MQIIWQFPSYHFFITETIDYPEIFTTNFITTLLL